MAFCGLRATVMGLGHFGGGVAAARWLARQAAEVTVTDLVDESGLAGPLCALAGVPIARFRLGGHREEDFREADLVVVNPAVRPDNRFVQVARESGVRVTSEIELFLDACPARIIGVTGSNGKSTTASMIAAILTADGRRTLLGGNIGSSLLERLEETGPDDWVVLELSSFQLSRMSPAPRMPEVAVVTNCTPNHLDWHGRYDDYRAAKQRILTGQREVDLAVLNTADPEVATWTPWVRGRRLPLVADAEIPNLPLPGEHNRANAICAATAARGIGCGWEAVCAALASYAGLPHRLERVATIAGRRFYNDSSSTTPDSTIAALGALEGPIWLLAGGSDKGIDLAPVAEAIVRAACGAALYGAVREKLRRRLSIGGRIPSATEVLGARFARLQPPGNRKVHVPPPLGGAFPCGVVETMEEAFEWCWRHSHPGDTILLSPACASHDQFQNYRRRGERFVELVRSLAEGVVALKCEATKEP